MFSIVGWNAKTLLNYIASKRSCFNLEETSMIGNYAQEMNII